MPMSDLRAITYIRMHELFTDSNGMHTYACEIAYFFIFDYVLNRTGTTACPLTE